MTFNKKYKMCNAFWDDTENFIADPDIALIGYQANFKHLKLGYLLFNHNCGTTLAIEVDYLIYLYSGSIFKNKKTGKEECPGYCLKKSNLESCQTECECAFVRKIIQIVKNCRKNQSIIPAISYSI